MCSSSSAAFAALWLCAAAQAGTVTHGVPLSEPLPAAAARLPSIPAQTRNIEGHQVRCWQYGKLIIDEFRIGPMPEAPDAVLRLASGARGAVLDARNATCLIKPQSRAASPVVTPTP